MVIRRDVVWSNEGAGACVGVHLDVGVGADGGQAVGATV